MLVLGMAERAWAQAAKVAPVVVTSSIRSTRLPAKGEGVMALKMACTFCQRSCWFLLVCVSLLTMRRSDSLSMGVPHTDCRPRAIHSDWL